MGKIWNVLQQEYCLVQQVSVYYPARMPRRHTHIVQQQDFALRIKVMKTVSTIQENANDIYEDAKAINEERAAAEEAFEDTSSDVKDEEKTEE